MEFDVYAKADGRNREYRRGGHVFFTDEPVRLEEDQLTEELRSDPWLFLVAVEVAPALPTGDEGKQPEKEPGGDA